MTWDFFDSATYTKPGYQLKKIIDNSYSRNGMKGNGMKALQTSTLGDFRVGSCLYCASTESFQASAPANLGNGEIIGLVFSSTPSGTDTLYLKVTSWMQGTGIRSKPEILPKTGSSRFSIDGRMMATPYANGVQIGPDGAHPVLH